MQALVAVPKISGTQALKQIWEPLVKYDFRVRDLFVDLQDGLKLCRAIQLLQVAMDDRYSSAKFELLLRKGEDKVKIPNFFFWKWGNELSNTVLVEDNEGDLYAIDIHVEQLEGNAIAYFINGITDIRDIYCAHRTCLANFQFMGQSKFVAHMTPLRPSRNEDPASMPPPTCTPRTYSTC
ncbi:abnormal spindle microcephaly-associated protein [Spatholobus suberectus]|nr:abnormal spindle microcephaly-associated protein [Spatholobus suberectus]